MAEPITPAPGANDALPANTPQPKTSEPKNSEELQNSLNAARRREQEAADKLAETTKRLETLEAQQKEREDTELKKKEEWQELALKHESELNDLKPYREKWEAWEKQEAEKVESEMEGLSDTQKEIVSGLSLETRMKAISEFKGSANTSKPGIIAVKGGKIDGLLSMDEIWKMRNEGNPEWRAHYAKHKLKQGV